MLLTFLQAWEDGEAAERGRGGARLIRAPEPLPAVRPVAVATARRALELCHTEGKGAACGWCLPARALWAWVPCGMRVVSGSGEPNCRTSVNVVLLLTEE